MTRLLKWYEKFAAYGCLGLTIEVFFTAISDFFPSTKGYTYACMFFVWPIGVFLLEDTRKYISRYHFMVRALIYAVACLMIEYTAGSIFKYTLGVIPWDYSYSDWNVHGMIRLDYIPLWAIIGLVSEKLTDTANGVRIVSRT